MAGAADDTDISDFLDVEDESVTVRKKTKPGKPAEANAFPDSPIDALRKEQEKTAREQERKKYTTPPVSKKKKEEPSMSPGEQLLSLHALTPAALCSLSLKL